MTTNRDDNSGRRVHRPDRTAGPQPHERAERGATRSGDDLDPSDAPGQGSRRSAVQGRGDDPERGR